MADQLKTSIVRIRAADGAVAGAGCLIAERHVLTCSSVVARSLSLAVIPADAPQSAISLDFPLLNPALPLAARVVFW
jgi:hypothetical protein